MDFSYTDIQQSVSGLANDLFTKHCTPERLASVDDEHGFDLALWSETVSAGLLEVWLSGAAGGTGHTFLDVVPALQALGKHVAPIPLASATVAIGTLDRFGAAETNEVLANAVAGRTLIVPALEEVSARVALHPGVTATSTDTATVLTGTKVSVPFGDTADHFLVTARHEGSPAVFLVAKDGAGLTVDAVRTTNRAPAAHLSFDHTAATLVGDTEAAIWLYQHATVTLCAVQAGVLEAALALTAQYTSEREQFGKPLSSFQAVLQRAADGFISTQALLVTTLFAAWELCDAREAAKSTAVAKWWASQAGHQVVHSALHLHGGIGNDLDYPLHRYYLWGKQFDATLGSSGAQLEELGSLLGTRQP